MSVVIKWLLVALALLLGLSAIVLAIRYGALRGEGPARSGAVPADQSYPFSAEAVLAGAGRPAYTVFEFQVDSGNNPEVHLTSFMLSSSGGENAPAGEFSIPSRRANPATATFTDTLPVIMVDFTKLPEGELTVTRDNPATFAVLALPRTYSGLSITFIGDPIGKKTLRLSYKDGTPITFAALKRHRIKGLSLPDA